MDTEKTTGDIIFRKKGCKAYIVLNRPEKLNTLNHAMYRTLNDLIDEIEVDPEIRVVVMKGNGHVFSAGYDISAEAEQANQEFDILEARMMCKKTNEEAFQINIFRYWAAQEPKCIFINMYFQGPWWLHWAGIIKKAFTDSGIAKRIPIVLRVAGNKADEARELLKGSGMYITETYADGCDLAIKMAKEGVR